MERSSKRIMAIAIIAVVFVGGGFGVYYGFFRTGTTYAWSAADCPGAPSNITPGQIIKIGVIGDMGTQTGDGTLHGVQLAAREINSAGGIKLGLNTTYYYGVTSEDTDEAAPSYDPSKATAAAESLVNYKQVNAVIGGFRTEMVVIYAPLIMSHNIPFLSTGSAYDDLCLNYATGKGLVAGGMAYETYGLAAYQQYAPWVYFFRNMPLGISNMAQEIANYLVELANDNINGTETVTRFNIVREDLSWNLQSYSIFMKNLTIDAGLTLGATLNYSIGADSSTIQAQMNGFWDQVNTNGGNSFTIPLISAVGSLEMLNSYVAKQPNSIICGIDVPSQDHNFFNASNKNSRYEINYLSLIEGVNKTSLTHAFWMNYVANYTNSPSYTAIGSYDALNIIHQAVKAFKSFSGPSVRTYLESRTSANPIEGAGGYAAYTPYHDLVEGYPLGYGLFCQWVDGSSGAGSQVLLASSQYSAGGFSTSAIAMPSWW